MNYNFFANDDGCVAISFDTQNSTEEKIAEHLHCDREALSKVKEVHSTTIKCVTGDNYAETDIADGMITNIPGIPLVIQTADCVPVFLRDPVRNVVGVVHSGRKGCAQEIILEAINICCHKYGCEANDIHIGIGPCICGECYEVGAEMKDEFVPNFDESTINRMFREKSNGKFVLDMKEAIRYSLHKAHTDESKIEDCQICTYESAEYTSYRRYCHEGETGDYFENRSVIMLT